MERECFTQSSYPTGNIPVKEKKKHLLAIKALDEGIVLDQIEYILYRIKDSTLCNKSYEIFTHSFCLLSQEKPIRTGNK